MPPPSRPTPALLPLQDRSRGARAPPHAPKRAAILNRRMLLRRSKPRDACQRLRRAVDAMPRPAKEAMLRGIDDNTIIVGAYVDRSSGGICPMLAAHRNGGRTDLASFARSWDRYTDARRPRLATQREVRTLRTLLQSSLAGEDVAGESLRSIAAEIRADRARLAELPPAKTTHDELPEPITPPERPGMLIRIRRLTRLGRRRDERATTPA